MCTSDGDKLPLISFVDGRNDMMMRCSRCSAVSPRRAAARDQPDEADWLPCQHCGAGRRVHRLRPNRTHHGIHAVWKPTDFSSVRTRRHK